MRQTTSVPGITAEWLTLLRRTLNECHRFEGARTQLVIGEAGHGKTSLVQDFQEDCARHVAGFFVGRADAYSRNVPLSLARDVVASIRSSRTDKSQTLTQLAKSLATSEFPQSPTDLTNHQLTTTLRLFHEFLNEEVREKAGAPIVLVFEDLHHADAESAALFANLGRQLIDVPVLVLGTLRPTGHTAHRIMDTVTGRLGFDTSVNLPPWEVARIQQFVRGRRGLWATPRLVDILLKQTGGVPFYVSLFLDALEDDGLLRSDGEHLDSDSRATTGIPIRVPSVSRLLVAEDPAQRELIPALAALGRATPTELQSLSGATLVETERIVSRLVAEGVLSYRPDGLIEFSHGILLDAAYGSLRASQRALIHERIAQTYETRVRLGEYVDPFELARHVCLTDRTANVVAHAAGVAAAHSAGVSASVAAHWYNIAAENSDGMTSSLYRIAQAFALLLGNEINESIHLGRHLLDSIEPSIERDKLMFAVNFALFSAGHFDTIDDYCLQALANQPDSLPAKVSRCFIATHTGRWGEVVEIYEHSLEELWEYRDSLILSVVMLCQMAMIANLVGRQADEMRLFNNAEALCARLPKHMAAEFFRARGNQLGGAPSSVLHAKLCLERADALVGGGITRGCGARTEITIATLGWLTLDFQRVEKVVLDSLPSAELGGAVASGQSLRAILALCYAEQGRLEECKHLVDSFTYAGESAQVLQDLAHGRWLLRVGESASAASFLVAAWNRISSSGYRHMSTCLALSAVIALRELDENQEALRIANQAMELVANLDECLLTGWAILAYGMAAECEESVAHAYDIFYREGSQHFSAFAASISGPQACNADITELLILTERSRAFSLDSALRGKLRSGVGSRDERSGVLKSNVLSDTEASFALLARSGSTNREISSITNYSIKTVELYLARVYRKLGVRNRYGLVGVSEDTLKSYLPNAD